MCRGVLRSHVEEQFFGPKGWEVCGLRMIRIDLIDRRTLIFEFHDYLEKYSVNLDRLRNQTYLASPYPGQENPCEEDSLRYSHLA